MRHSWTCRPYDGQDEARARLRHMQDDRRILLPRTDRRATADRTHRGCAVNAHGVMAAPIGGERTPALALLQWGASVCVISSPTDVQGVKYDCATWDRGVLISSYDLGVL